MALPGFAAFLITVLVVSLVALAGWLTFTHLRARRLGLPPPSLNPFDSAQPRTGGLFGRVSAAVRALRYRRVRRAGGNFEGDGRPLGSFNSNSGGGRSTRGGGGFSALDPDEAWDARVGNEADAYAPGAYGEEEAGTFVGGGLDRRYDEEMGRAPPGRNPFDDDAAVGGRVRALSPRPVGEEGKKEKEKEKAKRGKGEEDPDSPGERRSMFREEM